MGALEDAVTQHDDLWDFTCPGVVGDMCGEPGGVNFTSTGWPTKKVALARGRQHLDQHKFGIKLAELVRAHRVENPDDEPDIPALAQQVMDEHDLAPMQELHDFRVDQGLAADGRAVTVEDL